MAKIKNGFDKLSDNNLLVKGGSISTAMTGNPNFPTLDRKTAAVTDATRKFSDLLDAAKSGDRVAIAAKDTGKTALITVLRLLGNGVTDVAQGDLEQLTSSRFSLVKQRQPAPPLVTPQPALLSGSNRGEIKSKGKRQKGARSVLHMISPDPIVSGSWTTVMSTRIKHVFTNLESAKKYWVKIGLTGVNNQLVESEAVSYVTQ